jgi:hypothetical protein
MAGVSHCIGAEISTDPSGFSSSVHRRSVPEESKLGQK